MQIALLSRAVAYGGRVLEQQQGQRCFMGSARQRIKLYDATNRIVTIESLEISLILYRYVVT